MTSGRAPYILLVEDDVFIRDSLAEALRLDGYEVSTAPNGRVALESTRERDPDLVLLDLRLPEMDGPTFAERYRQLSDQLGSERAPIVVITASLPWEIDEKLIGADEVLHKPFELLDVLGVVALRTAHIHNSPPRIAP